MAGSQDNEDDDWENEVELHMIDMCHIFTAQNLCTEIWCIVSSKDIFHNIGTPSREWHFD